MISPFSPNLRQYISWESNCELESMQIGPSLIGKAKISAESAHRRIYELRQQEAQLGFVYYAEKQWLEHQLADSTPIDYQKWVVEELSSAVFSRLDHVSDHDDLGEAWIGNTEDVELFWRPTEFSSDSIQFDNVQLIVPSDEQSPSPQHFCNGLKILHNLAYFLHLARESFRDRIWLDEVVVEHGGLWHLDLINEYGSVGRTSFSNHDILNHG